MKNKCLTIRFVFNADRYFQKSNPPKHLQTIVSTTIVHTSGIVFDLLSKMSKNIFKICSYIQKNTQNPNAIFKITTYCTKYTPNAKILSQNSPQIEHLHF